MSSQNKRVEKSAQSTDVLVVVSDINQADIVKILQNTGVIPHTATPLQALNEVMKRATQVVVLDAFPGSQSLALRLVAADARVVAFADSKEGWPHGISIATSHDELVSLVKRTLNNEHATVQLSVDELKRFNRRNLVTLFAEAIVAQIELPSLVEVAVAKTQELCEADGASVLLYDADTGELCFQAISGGGTSLNNVRLKKGQGIAWQSFEQMTPVLVADAQKDVRVNHECDTVSGFKTGSLIAAPLLLAKNVVGVIEAVRATGRQPFDEAVLTALVELAPHIAIAVHNAQVNADLKRVKNLMMRANADLEQKVIERTAQIGRAKQQWERTFDSIAEPIVVMNGYKIIRTNKAYAKTTGVRIQDLPGKKCYEVMAGRTSPCVGCPLNNRQPEVHSGEVRINENVFIVSAFSVSDESAETDVVVQYRDLTGQRQLESRLRQTEHLAAVGQLASGAAHEINNPLSFLTSNLSSLQSDLNRVLGHPNEKKYIAELLEDGPELISEAITGAKRIATIIKSMRDLARQKIGRVEPVDVNACVKRVAKKVFAHMEDRVVFELDATQHCLGDAMLLDQSLSHVMQNAAQAVAADDGKVHIKTIDQGMWIKLIIKDDGPGIRAEHLPRIFEPFFTTRGVGKGVGLGLTAAYNIARHFGGTIEVQSEVGAGATFVMALPGKLLAPAVLAANATPSETPNDLQSQ